MHIDSKATITDIPILNVRQFLRRNANLDWNLDNLAQALKITPEEAQKLIAELQSQEYIEPSPVDYETPHWQNTIKGNALANASAAKPVGRAKADKAFAEFMERVNQVNQDPYFLFTVVKVALFGSYLTDAIAVNDVDLAVEIIPKEDDINRRSSLYAQRRNEAKEKGIHFKNYTDYICWPEIEVWKFLKGRSRVISMHPMTSLLDSFPYRIVYSEEQHS